MLCINLKERKKGTKYLERRVGAGINSKERKKERNKKFRQESGCCALTLKGKKGTKISDRRVGAVY